MKMKNLILINIIIALFLTACNNSDNIKSIDFAKEYPNADAVYLTMTKEYVLNEDGSVDYTYSHKQTLLTHVAFNRLYGETFVTYNPNSQQLTINKAETEMADGTIVPSPDNAFNEVLPHGAENAPAYNHLREMVITHTGLEVGATIDLSYTIHSNEGYFPAFMGAEYLQMNSPIRELNIIVKVPENVKLNFANFKCDVGMEKTNDNGKRVYSFNIKNIPAISPDRRFGHEEDPVIIFSNSTLEEVQNKFKTQEAFSYQTDELIDKYIEENKFEELNIENALDLQKYVVGNINTYHLSLKETAYKLLSPSQVWKANGGTEIEKTILLTTLLKKYGYDATPIAVCENYIYDQNIGVLDVFNQYLIRLNIDNQFYYLSATNINNHNLKYELEDMSIINLDSYTKKFLIDEELPNNEIKLSGELSVNDKRHINGELNAYLSGQCNQYYKLVKDDNSAKSIISGIDVYKSIVEEKTNAYSDIIYEIKDADGFDKQANYYFFQLPTASSGISSWHLDYLASERSDDLKIPFTIKEEYAFKITIPEGMSLVSTLADVNQSNNIGIVIISITKEDNVLTIYRKIDISKTSEVNTQDYLDFRNMINTWNNKKFSELILKEI